jgi:Predicted redox protein, regulator of disulfide bond formation
MDLRSIQKPLKDKYRNEPGSSVITLKAEASQVDSPIACSIEVGQKIVEAQAHTGVGGPGTAACSGDLLLGALAACAQLTCQLVATAMGIPFEEIRVEVDGEMDLRGTLGVSKEVPVGFQDIHARFDIRAPEATSEQLALLKEKTEQYCVVLQTLKQPPPIRATWSD